MCHPNGFKVSSNPNQNGLFSGVGYMMKCLSNSADNVNKPKDLDIILICFPILQLPIRRPMVRKLTVGGSWSMLKEAEPSRDGCHGD